MSISSRRRAHVDAREAFVALVDLRYFRPGGKVVDLGAGHGDVVQGRAALHLLEVDLGHAQGSPGTPHLGLVDDRVDLRQAGALLVDRPFLEVRVEPDDLAADLRADLNLVGRDDVALGIEDDLPGRDGRALGPGRAGGRPVCRGAGARGRRRDLDGRHQIGAEAEQDRRRQGDDRQAPGEQRAAGPGRAASRL